MGVQWPKENRRLAREGFEAIGVILAFRAGDSDGVRTSQPVARLLAPDGSERQVSNGLSATSNDLRGRGDLLHLLVSPDKDLAVVLAEPVSFVAYAQRLREGVSTWNPLKLAKFAVDRGPEVEWGRRVSGEVVELVGQAGGGTRTRLRFEGREELVGPVVPTPDPRRVGDPVDLGLSADGSVVREPEPAGEGGAELRAEMAVEPGLLTKVWRSSWF